jgi:hypothetical protein
MVKLFDLDPANYSQSDLHSAERIFRENNCYVDVWIEVLHSLGINPASSMAFACNVDFEGDQWTFAKPPAEDLYLLFGIDVHEMQLYRPVVDHIVDLVRAGRTMIIEVDSFYLPDTAATTYQTAHVKSSIAVGGIDPEQQRLNYFHNTGYYELSGQDYQSVFRLTGAFSKDVLPPYVETVRFSTEAKRSDAVLRAAGRELLARHIARRPQTNPWEKFGDSLAHNLPRLRAGTEEDYHAYAFATLRQCGSAFELAKSFVEWLGDRNCLDHEIAVASLDRMASAAKTLLLKVARRREFDFPSEVERLASEWQTAMHALERLSSVVCFEVA